MTANARRLVAVLVAVALAVTACGGGSGDEPELTNEPSFGDESLDTETTDADQQAAETDAAEAPESTPEDEPVAEPDEVEAADDDLSTTVVTATPTIVGQIEMFDGPDGDAITFYEPVTNPTYFGTDLAMVVTEGSETDDWVKVQLPVRPNGTEGWIRSAGWEFSTHDFRAEINVTANTVTVWEGSEVLASTSAVDGKPSTPTPLGRFFVNDKVPGGNGAYGPWILSLSAYSEAMETFDGGLPVIAIHGTNQPELIGTDASNGCVRIQNDVIQILADTVPLGTPVDIVA